ncbi:MAG: PEP/pyruvate-binding domain-containing protein [Candidatus Competibacter denitrificans]
MKAGTDWYLSWEAAFTAGSTQAGGKGWNLARLARYGFRVPPGGVLSVAAGQHFLAHHSLQPEKIAAAGAEHLDALALPTDLADAIDAALECWGIASLPLAVRSSAVGEDAANASFAGILDSFLNVSGREALHRAIRRCWASAWSARASAYRERMGIAADQALPAVVLMALIQPQTDQLSAGVAFSCDPQTGREDRLFIAANNGYGETVVGGNVDPDEFLVEVGSHSPTPLVAERRQGRKERRSMAVATGGTEIIDAAPATGQASLNDEQLLRLARLTQRVAWALGNGEQHQDIEWVFDGADFHIVQARPVTTRPRYTYPALRGQPEFWSNGNFRDALPMAQSALNWTLQAHPIRVILESMLRATGYPLLPGVSRSKLWRGRGYFNLGVMQWEYWEAVGNTPSQINHFVGGHQESIAVPAQASWAVRRKRWRYNLKLIAVVGRARRQADAVFQRLRATAEAERTRDWRALPDRALIESLLAAPASFENEQALLLLQSSSAASWMVLDGLLKRWFGAQSQAIANALLIDGAPITSAQHGRALAELAESVTTDPAAARFFAADPFIPTAWRELPPASSFRQGFQTFLDEYGHRCVYELDLRNPRWREDPGWLLETIRTMVGSAAEYRKTRARRPETAAATWRQIETTVPRWLHGVIRWLARQSAREAEQREMAKSTMVRQAEVFRMLALEIGRRLTERGLLPTVDDVFHCTLEDLSDLMEGYWDGKGLAALVADRQERLAQLQQEIAPDTLVEDQPAYVVSASACNDPSLHGLGVAAGIATGPACLTDDPRHAQHLAAGDVLVAPSTDPAWTPLFLRAAALVTETGGFVSHGAIVAREYGIPAVVNVPGVMQRLVSGARVTVDGNQGTVTPGEVSTDETPSRALAADAIPAANGETATHHGLRAHQRTA